MSLLTDWIPWHDAILLAIALIVVALTVTVIALGGAVLRLSLRVTALEGRVEQAPWSEAGRRRAREGRVM
jgi:hypothetical protein